MPPLTAVRVTFTVRPRVHAVRTLARGIRLRESLSGPCPRVCSRAHVDAPLGAPARGHASRCCEACVRTSHP